MFLARNHLQLRILVHVHPVGIHRLLNFSSTTRPDSNTRPLAPTCPNNNVDSTPVTSSSSQIGNFTDTPNSAKSKKSSKPVKKSFFLGNFDNAAITHINRDAEQALYQTCSFVKKWKSMRRREYVIGIIQPNGEIVLVSVTEHFHLLNVLSQMIVANDIAVERIAHRILHYATVRNKFVPNVIPPGHVLDILPLLHIDLVNAFLMDQANPVQVNTYDN